MKNLSSLWQQIKHHWNHYCGIELNAWHCRYDYTDWAPKLSWWMPSNLLGESIHISMCQYLKKNNHMTFAAFSPNAVVMSPARKSNLIFKMFGGGSLIFFGCDQAALWMVQSVCLSVCLSHLFKFPSSNHHDIFRNYYQCRKWWPCKRSRSRVKGEGQRGQNPT